VCKSAQLLSPEKHMAMQAKAQPAGGGQGPLLTEQQVIAHYRQLLGDCNAIRKKIAELEQDISEHE
jgi:hypothetical protein